MKQQRIEFVLEAQQPIAHHEESFGNSAVAMRRKIRLPDGEFARVPIITADTMRHGMREASSYALLDAAGLLGSPSLTEPALRLLFSGGMITGSAGGSVKLGDYRDLVDLVPTLALFGGAAQNRVIPGRLMVDDAILICDETQHRVPSWVFEDVDSSLDSHRSHIEEVQRVRMDASLDPGKRQMLTAGEVERIEGRLAKSENASALGDAKAKDEAKSAMLPRRFETIVSGSLFFWSVTATTYSALEEDTFMVSVASFLHHAVVGGKKGTGHGLVKAIAARGVALSAPSERMEVIDTGTEGALSTGRVGELFRAHVRERGDRIASFLDKVAA